MANTKSFQQLIEDAKAPVNDGASARGDLSSPFFNNEPVVNLDDEPKSNRIPGIPIQDLEPHNMVLNLGKDDAQEEYNAILREVLAGRAIIRTEDATFTKEGDRLLAIVWLTKKATDPSRRKILDEPSDDD